MCQKKAKKLLFKTIKIRITQFRELLEDPSKFIICWFSPFIIQQTCVFSGY